MKLDCRGWWSGLEKLLLPLYMHTEGHADVDIALRPSFARLDSIKETGSVTGSGENR